MSKNAAPEFIISKEFGKYEPPKPCKDLVVVVRCKDCKFYPDGKGTTKWLPCREIIVPPMWFCADGKRKEEQEKNRMGHYVFAIITEVQPTDALIRRVMAPFESEGFYDQFPTNEEGEHIIPGGFRPAVLWDYYEILSRCLLYQNYAFKLEDCYAILPNIYLAPVAKDMFIGDTLIDGEKAFLATCEAVKLNAKPTTWVTFVRYHS